ncbi:MAG: hypothetical protein US89_C0018G0007 [Candidatus Peregrinibacteria bacterium GW2011_GWF2_38_29]|nr:MAG: hypothetical protein US89_C0018G0007 [Candidatus Peregrinibacteria bacterium GW2011_GWF2_38_29]HBB02451.1 hypothetical protein [Candidatus Peregrinibacteria bacterium]
MVFDDDDPSDMDDDGYDEDREFEEWQELNYQAEEGKGEVYVPEKERRGAQPLYITSRLDEYGREFRDQVFEAFGKGQDPKIFKPESPKERKERMQRTGARDSEMLRLIDSGMFRVMAMAGRRVRIKNPHGVEIPRWLDPPDDVDNIDFADEFDSVEEQWHDLKRRPRTELTQLPRYPHPIHLHEFPSGWGGGEDTYNDDQRYVQTHFIRCRHYLKFVENQISEPGDVQLKDGKATIRLSRVGTRPMMPDEVAARWFAYQRDEYGSHEWCGDAFTPKFYAEYIQPYVRDIKANNAFDWALPRAQIALSFCVAMGYAFDMPLNGIRHQFERLAKEIFDKIPADLDCKQTFSVGQKEEALLKVVKGRRKNICPESGYFILKVAEYLTPEMLKNPKINDLLKKMGTWVNNGFNVNRLVDLYRKIVRYQGAEQALESVLTIMDNVYGGKDRPWYFMKNLKLDEDMEVLALERCCLAKPDEVADMNAKSVEVVTLLTKYAGFNYQYALELYRKKGNELMCYMNLEETTKIVCEICGGYGIGNVKRAENVIDLLLSALKNSSSSYHAKFIQMFMDHAKKVKPRSELQGKLEGDDVNLEFPGFSALMASLYGGNSDRLRELKLDDLVLNSAVLEEISVAISKPLLERIATSAPTLGDDRDGQTMRRHKLLTNQSAGRAALPNPTMKLALPAEIAALSQRSGVDVLYRMLEFYEQVKAELGFFNETVVSNYFAVHAHKMPDPFKPISGIFKVIRKIGELPSDMARVNAAMFADVPDALRHDDFAQKIARESREVLERNQSPVITFNLAISYIIDLYIRGILSEKKVQEIFTYLLGEEIVVRPSVDIKAYVKKHGKGWHVDDGKDKKANRQCGIEHATDEYYTRVRDAGNNLALGRFNSFAAVVLKCQHLLDLLIITGCAESISSNEMLSIVFEKMLGGAVDEDWSVDLERDKHDHDHDGDWREEAVEKSHTDFLNPHKTPDGEGEDWVGFIKELRVLTGKGIVRIDKLNDFLQAADSAQTRFQILEDFYLTVVALKDFLKEAESIGRGLKNELIEEDGEKLKFSLTRIENLVKNIKLPTDMMREIVPADQLYVVIANLIGFMTSIDDIKREVDSLVEASLGDFSDVKKGDKDRLMQQAIANSTAIVLTFFGVLQGMDIADARAKEGMALLSLPKGEDEASGGDLSVKLIKAYRDPEGTRSLILREVRRGLIPMKETLEINREGYIGILPIGGKIHVLHPIEEKDLEAIKMALGIRSTAFKLIHAGSSLILPPCGTAEELKIIIAALHRLRALDSKFPELQVSLAGKLPNHRAAVLGSSILLSTVRGVEYPIDAFSTNQDETTGARIMAYNDRVHVVPNVPFPFMRMLNGKVVKGRIDMLGRIASDPEKPYEIEDIKPYQFIGTALINAQHKGAFAEVGKWYEDKYFRLLKGYGLDGILDREWVFKKEAGEASEASHRDHYETVKKCTDAWFDCASGGSDVVYKVRTLIDEMEEKIAHLQATLPESTWGNDVGIFLGRKAA